jgi:hypothetical protein
VSEDASGELNTLTAALHAAQLEKAEAYIQSDWHRVWELTNNEIPKLEREIAILTGMPINPDNHETSALAPLDFDGLLIEVGDIKNSLFNTYLKRQPARLKQVKVCLTFSELQKAIVTKHLREHAVFYASADDAPVIAFELLEGTWTSRPMGEADAEQTAENARQGINDLRLIIHERVRHRSD